MQMMMQSAVLLALFKHLLRTGAIHADDIDHMQRDLLARGEPEAAAFVAACFIEWSASERRPALSIVTDGGNPV